MQIHSFLSSSLEDSIPNLKSFDPRCSFVKLFFQPLRRGWNLEVAGYRGQNNKGAGGSKTNFYTMNMTCDILAINSLYSEMNSVNPLCWNFDLE